VCKTEQEWVWEGLGEFTRVEDGHSGKGIVQGWFMYNAQEKNNLGSKDTTFMLMIVNRRRGRLIQLGDSSVQ